MPAAAEPLPEVKAEPAVSEGRAADELDRKLSDAEDAYLESRRKKQQGLLKKKTAVAASAASHAVKTLPVHIPTISVPENLDAKELITEARDNTNGIIYRVVKALELPSASQSVQTALTVGAAKYGLIGLTTALAAMVGTSGSETKPSIGVFIALFLVILVAGTAVSAGVSWLCGLLLVKKGGGEDATAILRNNSCYAPISALAYVFCALILIFNKVKALAVLIPVILLSIIGHLMVMYREKRVRKLHTTLIYLLCLILAAAVVTVIALLFSSQIRMIWNALS